MAHSATERLPLKVLNVLVFIFFFSSGLYSFLAPGAPTKTSYITPAAWGLRVWTVIDLLLLGMVVLQFFDAGFEPVIEGLGFRFLIIAVLNGIFAYLFHHGHYIVGFVFAVLTTLAISQLYWDLKTKYPPKTTASALLVHLPFSLWHAYSVFLVVLTGFTAFGRDKHTHGAGVLTKVFAVIALVFLTSTSVGYAFHSNKGDIAGAAVIAYELLAIYQNQPHPRVIHWFALAGFLVSLLAILKAAFYTARSPALTSDDGERAPLIAGSD